MTVLALAETTAGERARLAGDAQLRLPGSPQIPRMLQIRWEGRIEAAFHVSAHVFTRGRHCHSVAYAGAHEKGHVRLSYHSSLPTLWLRHASFDLTASEAAEVERVFGPLGLQIERREL